MVQLPLSQVVGVPFDAFIARESYDHYKDLFSRCWEVDCKGEVQLQSADHQTSVQLSLNTLELEGGDSLSIILTDLTLQKDTQRQLRENNEELARAIEALEASNHDLQQFASVASHDLQEPLRKIQIYSNLMLEKETELSPVSKKYLDKIIDSSGRMKTLIIDILNYSRLSADHIQLECIDLSELLQELQEDFELIIQDKGATIHLGAMPCVYVNRGQIRQVFQNIISNALKFSKRDEAPVIHISAKTIAERSFDASETEDGDFCCITIKDNGIGFDEKYVGNIFALFERLNSKDKYEGTGIGLAIAKKIIDKHHGLLTAHSKEGEGSEFLIILPINQPQT
jgi:light-regulated signal transduction histidine kinase (bacteriophytochrome)